MDFETTLSSIDYKVRCLIHENNALKADLQKQTEANEDLREQLKNKTTEINNLNKQIDIIKLRNTLASGSDATELKLKINQLIRNIDRSIALLDKQD